jgi:hypothetical protein
MDNTPKVHIEDTPLVLEIHIAPLTTQSDTCIVEHEIKPSVLQDSVIYELFTSSARETSRYVARTCPPSVVIAEGNLLCSLSVDVCHNDHCCSPWA